MSIAQQIAPKATQSGARILNPFGTLLWCSVEASNHGIFDKEPSCNVRAPIVYVKGF